MTDIQTRVPLASLVECLEAGVRRVLDERDAELKQARGEVRQSAVASDPLVVLDTRKFGDAGKCVQVECREPSSCMSVELFGQSVAVNAAVDALERIHQSAHALREEP